MPEATPRARILRHESERGRWELALGKPALGLRSGVVSYQGYVERTTPAMRRRELPTGEVVLILQFDSVVRATDPRRPQVTEEHRRSFVAGVSDVHTVTELAPGWTGVQVNFTPLGAYRFFNVPMHELTNRVVDLDDVLGAEAGTLSERVHEAGTWEAKFAVLDSVITDRLVAGPSSSERIAWAWDRLQEPGTEIGRLAEAIGWSRKHLIARFHEQIGLPPARVARLARFNRAIRLLDGASGLSWTTLAHRCGYYDQSHLIRDFRDFAGAPPGELLRRRLPDGGGVEGD